ncbi:MAG: hypothetical protein RML84_11270 [Anaerolineae bacterium]|nr:hypothetical protein [Anaerolineae bacterium]
MMLLVSGATVSMRRVLSLPGARARIGVLATPRASALWARDLDDVVIAADNDAYCAWNEPRFVRMLQVHQSIADRVAWIAAPDVVRDARATLARWCEWAPVVRSYGYRVAYVVQDGTEDIGLPFADAYFVGGSDRYRASGTLRLIVRDLVDSGKWVHIGRVNSLARYRYWDALGCASCDGTQYSRWADRYLTWMLRRTEHRQLALESLLTGINPACAAD